MSDAATTPMMKQYLAMRRELPEDVLLFFRLGDFYELFFEDAKVASPILNVALTKRNGVPMCGVPHHSSQGYIAKLIKAGKRVAIGEQTSDPIPGKIVERAISQILSAGTVNDLNLLDASRPNYLAAVFREGKKFGLACVDHTTGEFEVSEFKDAIELADELERLQPSELLYSDEQRDVIEALGSPAWRAISICWTRRSTVSRSISRCNHWTGLAARVCGPPSARPGPSCNTCSSSFAAVWSTSSACAWRRPVMWC
jgi:DNA mismatch repair protein MutS